MIDITRAIEEGDLKIDDVIYEHNKNYFFDENPIPSVGTICYSDFYAGKKKGTAVFVPRYNGDTCMPHIYYQLGKKITNKNYKYESDTSLMIYYVTNPSSNYHQKPGAQGIRIPADTGRNNLFLSGALSGCSVAFLVRDDFIYFAHSGYNGTDPKLNDQSLAFKRNIRNKDLYNAIMRLENGDEVQEGMSAIDLLGNLSEKGYTGSVICIGDYCIIAEVLRNSLTLYEYNPFISQCDFMGVVNVNGRMQANIRYYDSNKKVTDVCNVMKDLL